MVRRYTTGGSRLALHGVDITQSGAEFLLTTMEFILCHWSGDGEVTSLFDYRISVHGSRRYQTAWSIQYGLLEIIPMNANLAIAIGIHDGWQR